MLEIFSNSKENLTVTFNLLNVENESIKFEAILHLSVFILMPERVPEINNMIKNNTININEFLDDYYPQKNQEEYLGLKQRI